MAGHIDVHHHCYPPVFADALNRNGGDPSGWWVPEWTVESDQALCKDIGVSTAIISCSAPGPETEPNPADAKKLARACNEVMASVRDQNPSAYGFFASVPSLLQKEDAIEEMAYALDVLKADGVFFVTRYGDDNYYIGHEEFTEIWDWLNARKAVVFVHPTHSTDTRLFNKHLAQPAWDYPHETGRAAIDMIISNMLRDHAKDCKIILSHAGGTLPYLIDRPAGLVSHGPDWMNPGKSSEEYIEDAKLFYYDTALSGSKAVHETLHALLGEEVYRERVLFGSDYPNAPIPSIEYFTGELSKNGVTRFEDLRKVGLKLFPRLAQN